MARKLRAVSEGERAVAEPPKSLSEAAGRDRRAFLVKARDVIGAEIDAGVPAHALARLITEMDRLDAEVRRLDARDKDEAVTTGVDGDGDEAFDSEAI